MDEKKLVQLMRAVIKEELNPINQKYEELNQRYQEMNQIIYALRDGQEELKAQLEGISLDVDKLHGEVKQINTRLEDLERGTYRIERLELRQNKTAVRVDTLEADVSLIREKLQN
ncbi:hypothetical protein PP175_23455 [Aneurinibacillus sp. Ricciae_BoGa-3]|uniref:hypothetical protein n=1 Tax=Aneurinibacillus sp. Ricciae_BoGa-3 TaxID=3022697 RepID=UPI00234198BF|nr:hypothetical protein [Aneurinibacillus sp. Ricciae_BoGa-3]WCK54209.1 hypothetical protein PP175_23455 [Aneurinibacillus sp. Ricciae_BoGa-3]